MRTLTQKYLGGYPLSEDTFQVDLQVIDKYVSFSTELLMLSLLGIAGYGFLIANIVLKVKTGEGDLAFLSGFIQPMTVASLITTGTFTAAATPTPTSPSTALASAGASASASLPDATVRRPARLNSSPVVP